MIRLHRSILLIAASVFLSLTASAAGFHPVHAKKAMVASSHAVASRVGAGIMKAGGNAVDAAVATGFALAVVHPEAGNIGGGGFMLFRKADGETHFLDFREKAPNAATANMYLDAKGNVIPGMSTIGYRAIGVPGTVAGLVYAEKKWGKLTLAQVMAPAIRLARDGVVLTYAEAETMRDPLLAKFPETYRIFQRNGRYYQPGEIFRQPELARTLERIAKNPETFYRGAMAHQLAADIQKGGGIITARDLAEYKVVDRRPVTGTYRGYEVISAPPPSSGGVVLIEILNILEGYDMASYGRNSAEAIHLTAEAERRAFYDRAEFLGDPDFNKLPVAQLIDKKYAAEWRDSISLTRATPSNELKRPSFDGLDRLAALHKPYIGPEPDHTTHYSVVDPAGNAVSVTYTLNDAFGSRVAATGLGFLLNDEMDDFSSKPGVPNMYGLIQGEANAIAPGHRPLSAMTPTMVTHDGKLFLVLGSPGGPTIITTVLNTLMNVIDYHLDIQRAVDSARFHHQWMPDQLRVEAWQLSPDTMSILEKMGYKLKRSGSWGDAECIMIDPKTGERLGASDSRDNGKAVGF